MKRKCEIKVRLTQEELERLDGLVDRTHLSREAFVRDMLAGFRIKEKPPVDASQLIMQVRRVGITLDQILKHSREASFTDMPELRKALESNRALEEEIHEIYAPYEGGK